MHRTNCNKNHRYKVRNGKNEGKNEKKRETERDRELDGRARRKKEAVQQRNAR